MPIHVLNIGLPEYCGICPVLDGETLDCQAGGSNDKNVYDGRFANCPIEPLLCGICGAELEVRQLFDHDGKPVKGLTLFCPQCAEKEGESK